MRVLKKDEGVYDVDVGANLMSFGVNGTSPCFPRGAKWCYPPNPK
jgi:hypothetical protein